MPGRDSGRRRKGQAALAQRLPGGDPRSRLQGEARQQGDRPPRAGEGEVADLRRPRVGEAGADQAGPPAGALGQAPAAEADRRGARCRLGVRGAGPAGARRRQPEGARADPRHTRLRPAADRPQPGRRVRLRRPARRIALPAPLPGRLLHRRRSRQPHRQARGSAVGGDAREQVGHPHRRAAVRPQRRLQPRAVDRAQGSRTGHAGGARRHRPGAAQPSRALRGARCARHGDRRPDRRALADLGRARLQRDQPSEDGVDDQPGGQLRLRASLHRRAARPADPGRRRDRRPRGIPLLPRRPALVRGPDRGPAPALRLHLRHAARRRDSAVEPLSRLGLHGRQRREHRRADAGDAQRRLRPARRHDDGRSHGSGILAVVRGHRRPGLHRGAGSGGRAGGHRHLRGSVLPGPELRAGRPLRRSGPTASRPATATTRRTSTASSPGWRSTGPTR